MMADMLAVIFGYQKSVLAIDVGPCVTDFTATARTNTIQK